MSPSLQSYHAAVATRVLSPTTWSTACHRGCPGTPQPSQRNCHSSPLLGSEDSSTVTSAPSPFAHLEDNALMIRPTLYGDSAICPATVEFPRTSPAIYSYAFSLQSNRTNSLDPAASDNSSRASETPNSSRCHRPPGPSSPPRLPKSPWILLLTNPSALTQASTAPTLAELSHCLPRISLPRNGLTYRPEGGNCLRLIAHDTGSSDVDDSYSPSALRHSATIHHQSQSSSAITVTFRAVPSTESFTVTLILISSTGGSNTEAVTSSLPECWCGSHPGLAHRSQKLPRPLPFSWLQPFHHSMSTDAIMHPIRGLWQRSASLPKFPPYSSPT